MEEDDKEFKVPRNSKLRTSRKYHSQKNLKFDEFVKPQPQVEKIVDQSSKLSEEHVSQDTSQMKLKWPLRQ